MKMIFDEEKERIIFLPETDEDRSQIKAFREFDKKKVETGDYFCLEPEIGEEEVIDILTLEVRIH